MDLCTLMYISHQWFTFKPFEKHVLQPLLSDITNKNHGKSSEKEGSRIKIKNYPALDSVNSLR